MEPSEKQVEARLRENSEMTDGLAEVFDEWAEDIIELHDAGSSEAEIDAWLLAEFAERGVTHEALVEELPEWLAEKIPEEARVPLMQACKFPEWFAYAARTYALTGQMAPMYPFSVGGIATEELEFSEEDEPVEVIWALVTPNSDVAALTAQIRAKAKEVYGKEALRPTDSKMLQDAQFARMHRLGFSYREIAMRFLHAKYVRKEQPGKAREILKQLPQHRAEIQRERERVKKAVKRAQRRWKTRALPHSPPE